VTGRDFAWILVALSGVLALEWALGWEPGEAASWLLFTIVVAGVVLTRMLLRMRRREG
jgi:uncharacterized membrane protein affecting hemolysin expression